LLEQVEAEPPPQSLGQDIKSSEAEQMPSPQLTPALQSLPEAFSPLQQILSPLLVILQVEHLEFELQYWLKAQLEELVQF